MSLKDPALCTRRAMTLEIAPSADAMRIVKQRLLEMLPSLSIFLDVDLDELEIKDLEKYIDASQVRSHVALHSVRASLLTACPFACYAHRRYRSYSFFYLLATSRRGIACAS